MYIHVSSRSQKNACLTVKLQVPTQTVSQCKGFIDLDCLFFILTNGLMFIKFYHVLDCYNSESTFSVFILMKI